MPKTAVETAVCDICGAGVREGSLFCYNCGGSLTKAEEPVSIPFPIEPAAEPMVESKANGSATEVVQGAEPQPDRRKVRAANRQPTEIVWELRDGVSWVFVIASLVFVIVALAIVLAAFYLR